MKNKEQCLNKIKNIITLYNNTEILSDIHISYIIENIREIRDLIEEEGENNGNHK